MPGEASNFIVFSRELRNITILIFGLGFCFAVIASVLYGYNSYVHGNGKVNNKQPPRQNIESAEQNHKQSSVANDKLSKNKIQQQTEQNGKPDNVQTKNNDCGNVFETEKWPGVYKLHPKGSAGFDAYCDQGWTTIMKRYDGSQDFSLYWDDYKHGFGNKTGEHWLGNDNLYYLTNQGNFSLRLEFTYWKTKRSYLAEYSHFKVDNEANKYRLSVWGYKGNSGRDRLSFHSNQAFSTRDRDNDKYSAGHCAQISKGGFWYNDCMSTTPTGPYQSSEPCISWLGGTSTHSCTSAFTIKMKALYNRSTTVSEIINM